MLIINRRDAKILRTPHGSEIRPLIDRTTSPVNQCSLAEEILPPGSSVTPHYHAVMEEIYYIIEGQGVMRINDEEREVGDGDTIYIPRFSRHTLSNTGDRPIRMLMVCGPAFIYEDHRTK